MNPTTMAKLQTELRRLGFTQQKLESSKTVSIMTDNNRVDVLQKVADKLGGAYDPQKGSSSIGATVVGQFTVKARPASKQGNRSAGLDNEDAMIDSINKFVKKGAMKVCITDGTKKYEYNNVVEVKGVGTDTANRKKADVLLCTADGKEIPISIKKDNAEMWESADSYWAQTAKGLVDKLEASGKVSVEKTGTVNKISPSIGIKATAAEKKAVVFGNDLLVPPTGFVVVRTFSSSDFNITPDGDCLKVTVTSIIDAITDLKGDKDIYFLIRNDSSRKGSKIRPGLRVLAVSKTRINKNVLVVTNRTNP